MECDATVYLIIIGVSWMVLVRKCLSRMTNLSKWRSMHEPHDV